MPTVLRLIGTLLLATGCAPGHVVQGRPYELQVPKGASGPRPLLLLLHGYSASGFAQDTVFPFSKEVDRLQFLYALPNGTRNALGKRFWNATDACCNFEGVAVDDVGFLRAVIDDVKAAHEVDASAVYLVGHSNGAFLALRAACEASDVVTGVVSVAGAAFEQMPACPGRPIPVLQIHGTADEVIHYDGGQTSGGPYPSALGTAERFAARNGCASTRTGGSPLDLVGGAQAESTREVFDGCPTGTPVELWTIPQGSHLPDFNAGWPALAFDWLAGHR